MSDSYHETRSDLKRKTKKEIEEMMKDSDSVLYKLAKKRQVKKDVTKKRQQMKKRKIKE